MSVLLVFWSKCLDTQPTSAIDSSAISTDASNQKISTERAYTNNAYFTRTVWLPRPVDTNSVVAKLEDGVLKLTVTKADDKGSVVVPIE